MITIRASAITQKDDKQAYQEANKHITLEEVQKILAEEFGWKA